MTLRQQPNQADPPSEREKPVLEKVQGPNFPYRGQEQHGVKSDSEPWPTPGTEVRDNKTGYSYMDPIKETDPIPVKIVSEYGRELRSWRTGSYFIDQARPYQLVGRDMGRTQIVIVNNGPDTLWIGPDSGVSALSGFPVAAGGAFTVTAHDPVYASVENGQSATVYTAWEFGREL